MGIVPNIKFLVDIELIFDTDREQSREDMSIIVQNSNPLHSLDRDPRTSLFIPISDSPVPRALSNFHARRHQNPLTHYRGSSYIVPTSVLCSPILRDHLDLSIFESYLCSFASVLYIPRQITPDSFSTTKHELLT